MPDRASRPRAMSHKKGEYSRKGSLGSARSRVVFNMSTLNRRDVVHLLPTFANSGELFYRGHETSSLTFSIIAYQLLDIRSSAGLCILHLPCRRFTKWENKGIPNSLRHADQQPPALETPANPEAPSKKPAPPHHELHVGLVFHHHKPMSRFLSSTAIMPKSSPFFCFIHRGIEPRNSHNTMMSCS